jgi:hypothetical protein
LPSLLWWWWRVVPVVGWFTGGGGFSLLFVPSQGAADTRSSSKLRLGVGSRRRLLWHLQCLASLVKVGDGVWVCFELPSACWSSDGEVWGCFM